MPWTMRHSDSTFSPTIRCDACGSTVELDGYVAWLVDWTADEPTLAPVLVTCSDECIETIAEARADEGEWIATPVSVYLANLIQSLGIDVDHVLQIERASVAAERTRDQSPE